MLLQHCCKWEPPRGRSLFTTKTLACNYSMHSSDRLPQSTHSTRVFTLASHLPNPSALNTGAHSSELNSGVAPHLTRRVPGLTLRGRRAEVLLVRVHGGRQLQTARRRQHRQ